jgi:hypothetical protein
MSIVLWYVDYDEPLFQALCSLTFSWQYWIMCKQEPNRPPSHSAQQFSTGMNNLTLARMMMKL